MLNIGIKVSIKCKVNAPELLHQWLDAKFFLARKDKSFTIFYINT